MKKSVYVVITVLLCVAVIACGSKYDDVESTLNDYADAMEEYGSRMEKADNVDAVVAAMNRYTEQMQSLAPRLQEMNQKFPELASGNSYPKALEKVSQRIAELSQKVQSAMMKTVQYMMDPQVQQAMTAQAQAMAQTGQ